MAKWINIHVTGATDDSGAQPAQEGDNLVLADDIKAVTTSATAGGGSAMAVILTLDGKTATCLVGTGASASQNPGNNVPASAGYIVKLKEAVNRAITANPGGVKSTVSLPQDSADNTAAYDFAKSVYFKSFAIS